jgi:hypothetical protein
MTIGDVSFGARYLVACWVSGSMSDFKAPMINLYSRDLPRALAFYSDLGFVEAFRTPATNETVVWTDDTDSALSAQRRR